MIKEAIAQLVEGKDLSEQVMTSVMDEIMSGCATDAQIGSFITALRIKGETIDEITGAAKVMRQRAVRIETSGEVIDTCGTGGDGLRTFNISTTAAFVVAGSGLKVAKHGNRSVSSKAGSADVLEALGVNVTITPDKVKDCIEKVGLGFLFAPLLHSSMKYAIGPRKEIGVRTIFNILGPLTNPAGAQIQLLGVFKKELTGVMATVLNNLGLGSALVVHGDDGLDEISNTGATTVAELKDRRVTTYKIHPADFGLAQANLSDIAGGCANDNAAITLKILQGEKGPQRDIVLLNAGACIYAAKKAADIGEGIKIAAKVIDGGQALKKLEGLREVSNS